MYVHTLTCTHEEAKKCQRRPKLLLEMMYRSVPMAERRSVWLLRWKNNYCIWKMILSQQQKLATLKVRSRLLMLGQLGFGADIQGEWQATICTIFRTEPELDFLVWLTAVAKSWPPSSSFPRPFGYLHAYLQRYFCLALPFGFLCAVISHSSQRTPACCQ